MSTEPTAPALEALGISKTFDTSHGPLTVLQDIHFRLLPGETMSLVGPSGSGKTTLLGLCAGLELPSRGSIRVLGHDWSALREPDLSHFRGRNLGFIFQSFHLLPTLRAWENVALPLELAGMEHPKQTALQLLERVGLKARTDHYPVQLSGGEQQRVAIARAFAHQPPLLLADEPTGNLDGANREVVADLLFSLNREHGTSLLLVTHDEGLAARCQHTLRLRDGRLETPSPAA